jgi:aryl-alcohol dehydrogenase-like predicted oxidoreductase
MGLGTTIWSPLASGLLTGKYNDGIPQGSRAALPGYRWIRARFESPEGQDQIAKVRLLQRLAEDLGITLPKLAVAWCLKNPHVSTVITGASRTDQVKENMDALAVLPHLTEDVMDRIEEILDNTPEPDQKFR